MPLFRNLVLALMFGALPTVALADRLPDAAERQAIENALRSQGFTSWGEIEFDDNRWEVDDAVGPDGRAYDLDLDASFNVVKRDLED